MTHPKIDREFAKRLAELVGDLQYDSLTLFLHELSKKMKHDSLKDEKRNRKRLALMLKKVSKDLKSASQYSEKAWTICQPYMQPTFQEPKSKKKHLK